MLCSLNAFVLAIAAMIIPAGTVTAADAGLRIHDPYVRLAPPGAPATGAFMLISNTGKNDRKLVKADSLVAKTVELHTHVNENGMMKMRQITDIKIKAGGQVELKPGSLHVMLIGMKQELKEGDRIAITLSFDDGSSQQVEAPVRKLQTTMPAAAQGGMKH